MRIYLYVHADDVGLPDYSLRVARNNTELPISTLSTAGPPGFTWPFQDARQRSQNWKVELPNITPEGLWQLQLVDSTGNIVGPAATYRLGAADTELELYVRYEQK